MLVGLQAALLPQMGADRPEGVELARGPDEDAGIVVGKHRGTHRVREQLVVPGATPRSPRSFTM